MITPEEFTDIFIRCAREIPDMGRPSSRWLASHGQCWYYAYVFVHILGGELYSYQTKDGSGHCFVKFQDKFYDAESIDGQSNWKSLQRYMNWSSDKNLRKHRSVNGFLKSWKIQKECKEVFDLTLHDLRMNLSFRKMYGSSKKAS